MTITEEQFKAICAAIITAGEQHGWFTTHTRIDDKIGHEEWEALVEDILNAGGIQVPPPAVDPDEPWLCKRHSE